jgi:hypothetical protein
MASCASFTLAMVFGATAIFGPSATLREGDKKGSQALNLETKHFKQAIISNAKTVGLEVKLDGKGSGKGTLSLDPNRRYNDGLSTGIAVTLVKVTLKEVQAEEQANKGRRIYEISGKGLDRLRLMVPTKSDGVCWLLIAGKDGIEDIVEMRPINVGLLAPGAR